MKLNLLTLSCVVHSYVVLAASTFETSQSTLQCFDFFQSLKKQSLNLTLQTTGEKDGENSLLVTIVKGTNFRSDVEYEGLDFYFCSKRRVDIGLCTAEGLGFLLPGRAFKDEGLVYKQVLTLSENSMVFDQIDQTLRYCVLARKRPDVDLIITPHYDGNLEGELRVNRWESILTALLGLLLTYVYVVQMKEWRMDNWSKFILSSFVVSHIFDPAFELIGITFISWDLSTLSSVMVFLNQLSSFTTSLAEDTFVTLLLRGYTVLPETEYPLVSKYYLPVAIALFLRLLSSLMIFLEFAKVLKLMTVVLYLYQVFQYYKTNKLLKSLSLRSPRRAQTLKVWLFYFPLALIATGVVGGLTMLIMYPSLNLEAPTVWRPRDELIGSILLILVVESLDFAILLRSGKLKAINGAESVKSE